MPELLDPSVFRLRQFPPNEISTRKQRSGPPVPGQEPDDDLYRERHQSMFDELQTKAFAWSRCAPSIVHIIRNRGGRDNGGEKLTDRLNQLAGLIAFGVTEVQDIAITHRKPLC